MLNQRGQVVLILVLVMTVALAIGISVVGRSLSDVSTATKVEQSSRAFSAAEAGIEDKLRGGSGTVTFVENSSQASISSGGDLIPPGSAAGNRQDPLEYPPLAKEETAQVWLANLDTAAEFYKQSSLDIYWGNSADDRAALELTLVYYDGSQYKAGKWYLDQITRSPSNHFVITSDCTGNIKPAGFESAYQCHKNIDFGRNTGLMLLRARLLYNSTSQPFAVQSAVICPASASSCNDYSIPSQAKKLISTGISGQTRRSVQLFQVLKVVPPFFDYAIFSTSGIDK